MNRRTIIDILMIVLMPLLMAYSLIGETFHEVAGTAMLILFIVHHLLNKASFKTIGKGRYTVKRALREAVNILLLVFMIVQPLTGIMMSKHLYTFLHISGAAKARQIHLFLAYWGFILMSVHAGMHMGPLANKLMANKGELKAISSASSTTAIITTIVIAAVSVYGTYAFFSRDFMGYMLMLQQFAFYDFDEPAILFILDYIAVMVLFMFIGWLTQRRPSGTKEKN